MKRNTWEALRFVAPVTLENTVTIFVGILLSTLIGGVSGSSLAAVSVPNQLINVYIAVYSLLTSGAAVLTSRLIGAGDRREASRTIEQSALLAVTTSAVFGAVSVAFARGIMRLLMPSAEEALLGEAVAYFRMLGLSFPFLALYTVLASVMRAADNSRAPMLASFSMNLVQVGAMFLFLRGLRLGMTGAGLSYLICRMTGAGLLAGICLKEHERFRVSLKGMLRPDGRIIRRICRIGLPCSVESAFVQGGYLLANMMVIALGTWRAMIFQIVGSLITVVALPSNITIPTVTTFVGHRLGAGDRAGARRETLVILLWGLAFSLALGLIVALLGKPLVRMYTRDEAAVTESAHALWILLAYTVCSVSINSIDPALRVGGDVKYVMWQTAIGVWVFRLPLSWLLGFHLNLGVEGILWANVISLAVRTAGGWARFLGGKWLEIKV